MNKLIFLFLFVLAIKSSQAQYALPEASPSDFKLTYIENKGIMNSYSNLFLSQDTCYYETIFQDITNKFSFKLTASDLNMLYKMLKGYKADKIVSKQLPKPVPERGGDNLLMQWKNNSVLISNSGNFKVEEKSQSDWEKIASYIKNLIKVETDKRSKNFTVKLDKSLAGKKIALYLNEELLYENVAPKSQEEVINETLATVPGTYYLKAIVGEPGIVPAYKIVIHENKSISLLLMSKTLLIR